MQVKSHIRRLISPVWTTLLLAIVICKASNAQGTLHSWIGPAAGTWLDTNYWDTATIPSGEDADVLIDGNAGQDSYVTLATPVSAWTNGVVSVDAGDTLKLTKSYAGSATLRLMGITNRGTLYVTPHASANAQATTVLSYGAGSAFNETNALVEIIGSTTGRNRVYVNFRIPLENTNDWTVIVRQPIADRNEAQFQLTDSGTFVNNGLIHIRTYGSGTYGSYYAKMVLISTDSGLTSSFLGTGRILLDAEDLAVPRDGTVVFSASANTHVVTNGASHTIEGAGIVSCCLVNLGLVRAVGTNGYLSVQNAAITEPYYGKPIVNTESGRLVAAGSCGMYIGTTSSNPSQFLNYGLLEARTGSFIFIRNYATTSTSKSTPASTMILEGTVAGGGEIIDLYRPVELASTATLAPGDLTNNDGTGASTVGQLSFVTNLIINAETTLDFQLGNSEKAGVDYDCVAVTGSLTLDGILNITALPDFGRGGEYTLFTCAPGELVDNGLAFGTLPADTSTPILTVDAGAGTVSVFFAPRTTLLSIR